MAGSELINQIDPEVIAASMGAEWANEVALIKYAPQVFVKDTRPIQKGTLISTVRNTFFQGTTGQSVKADQTIASVGRSQKKENHPVNWRYGSIDEDDVIAEIIPSDVEGAKDANAEYAEAGQMAAAQWLEDALIAAIEGACAANTGNQAGAGATATLALLLDGKAALADKGIALNGGASVMKAELYWMLVALGAISQSTNTFAPAQHDEIVRQGMLPANFLGSYAFPMDKISAAPGTDHYLYFLGPQSIILRAYTVPELEFVRKAALKAFGTIMNLKIKFAIGPRGMSWKTAGSDGLSDIDLRTAANWELAATSAKYVNMARVLTDNN